MFAPSVAPNASKCISTFGATPDFDVPHFCPRVRRSADEEEEEEEEDGEEGEEGEGEGVVVVVVEEE